jgi:hypothetical protein
MIAVMVAPFVSQSILSTAACLDDEAVGDFDDAVFEAVAFDPTVGFGRAGVLLLAGRFSLRDDLRSVLADFDLDLLVAIRPSWCLTTASRAVTDTSPAIERGIRRARSDR